MVLQSTDSFIITHPLAWFNWNTVKRLWKTWIADTDPPLSHKHQVCGGSQLAIEKMLQFGKELQAMSTKLKKDHGKNEANKKALQVSYSIMVLSFWTDRSRQTV